VSYTFRVVFDGVCAYVPNERFFDYDPKKRKFISRIKASVEDKKQRIKSSRSLAVLLPDLRRPGKPHLPSVPLRFPAFRDPHFPLLQFNLKDLREGTTRRVDLVSRDISSDNEEGNLFLRREQIRFNLDAENASTFSYADYIPDDPCQVKPDLSCPDQVESVWWLTDLQRVLVCPQDADAAVVNPKFLPSYRGPFPDGLIARVECTGGRLRTFDFNRDLDGEPLPWRFAAPADDPTIAGSWNRALSNSVALEFFDVRDEVRIELRRLANEVIVEELVLAPGPGASRPVVEIHISNLEPDRLFQEEGFSRSALPDFDFQPFYELSQISEDKIPHLPIPNPGRETFFGLREKPCAGGVMDTTTAGGA
jgi:hypothetical protein